MHPRVKVSPVARGHLFLHASRRPKAAALLRLVEVPNPPPIPWGDGGTNAVSGSWWGCSFVDCKGASVLASRFWRWMAAGGGGDGWVWVCGTLEFIWVSK